MRPNHRQNTRWARNPASPKDFHTCQLNNLARNEIATANQQHDYSKGLAKAARTEQGAGAIPWHRPLEKQCSAIKLKTNWTKQLCNGLDSYFCSVRSLCFASILFILSMADVNTTSDQSWSVCSREIVCNIFDISKQNAFQTIKKHIFILIYFSL